MQLIKGVLHTQDGHLAEVHAFWSEEGFVTLSSTKSQKILFIHPDDTFILHYHQGLHSFEQHLAFHSINTLHKSPYYVFRLVGEPIPTDSFQPFSARFQTDNEQGVASVIAYDETGLTWRHTQPISTRTITFTFKRNNQIHRITGRLVWHKKVDRDYTFHMLFT